MLPVRHGHRYLTLHHSRCQLLSTEMDYIKFCYWKIFGTALTREVKSAVIRFLHIRKIPGCEHTHRLQFPSVIAESLN